jgi:hypothetical protein
MVSKDEQPGIRDGKAKMASLIAYIAGTLPEPKVKTSAPGILVLVACQLVSIGVFWRVAGATLGSLFRTPPPAEIPAASSTTRFGIPEDRRREIFRLLAESENKERQRAISQNTWRGHAWSREDDLGWVQRTEARRLASRFGLSLSQIYLVFDEGIRERWPGPDGQPLRATTAPINLRTE